MLNVYVSRVYGHMWKIAVCVCVALWKGVCILVMERVFWRIKAILYTREPYPNAYPSVYPIFARTPKLVT